MKNGLNKHLDHFACWDEKKHQNPDRTIFLDFKV